MAFDPGGFLRSYRLGYFDQSLPASVTKKAPKSKEVEPPAQPQAAPATSVETTEDAPAPEPLVLETTASEVPAGGTGPRMPAKGSPARIPRRR